MPLIWAKDIVDFSTQITVKRHCLGRKEVSNFIEEGLRFNISVIKNSFAVLNNLYNGCVSGANISDYFSHIFISALVAQLPGELHIFILAFSVSSAYVFHC